MAVLIVLFGFALAALGVLYARERARRKRLSVAIRRLVGLVGHEINNPLSYVLTNLELLEEQFEEDLDVWSALDDARDGALRVRKIVRGLQSFSSSRENELVDHIDLALARQIGHVLAKKAAANAPVVRRRVLVVDDEPLVCRAIQKSLDADHDVVTDTSPLHALDRIRVGARYDVVFCDLMMPEISGTEFYDALREIAPEMLPCVVFMTGGVFDDHTREALTDMEARVLEKPITSTSLRRVVAESMPCRPGVTAH
ncbi:MAG: response regulator [Polyangiaceae bacterium]